MMRFVLIDCGSGSAEAAPNAYSQFTAPMRNSEDPVARVPPPADAYRPTGLPVTLEHELLSNEPANLTGQSVIDMAVRRDSLQAVTLASNGELHFIRFDQPQPIVEQRQAEPIPQYRSLAMDHNGQLLAAAQAHSRVDLFDVRNKRSIFVFRTAAPNTQTLKSVRFEPDGTLAVSSVPYSPGRYWDGDVTVTRFDVRAAIRNNTGWRGWLAAIARKPFVVPIASKETRPKNDPVYGYGKDRPTIQVPAGYVRGRVDAVSPDGKLVAATLRRPDKQYHQRDVEVFLGLFDKATGKLVGGPTSIATEPVDSLEFMPDGRLLSGGPKKAYQGGATVRVWRIGTATDGTH